MATTPPGPLGRAVRGELQELFRKKNLSQETAGEELARLLGSTRRIIPRKKPKKGQAEINSTRASTQSAMSRILHGRREPSGGLDTWALLAQLVDLPLSTLIAHAEMRLARAQGRAEPMPFRSGSR